MRPLRDGEALVRVEVSSISPGTELRALAGEQAGSPPTFIPGYGAVGIVIEGGGELNGRRVFAGGSNETGPFGKLWGGHQSHVVRPTAMLASVPDGVTPEAASLAKLASIARRGARHVEARRAKRVAVLGLGPIGQFAAQIYRAFEYEVVAFDRSGPRVAVAAVCGVEAIQAEGGAVAALGDRLGNGFDVVIDATGSLRATGEAVALLREPPWHSDVAASPLLLVQGSYAGDFSLNYVDAFFKEATVIFTRDAAPVDVADVLRLMADRRLTTDGILTDVLPPERAGEAYDRLRDPSGGNLTFAFDWRG